MGPNSRSPLEARLGVIDVESLRNRGAGEE